ncbi:MAG: chemoreceptor glutamine deamidase CheD [Sedimenticola sp.]
MAPNQPSIHTLPPTLLGFDHINRYWDSMHATFAAKILPGQFYVSDRGEAIVTVLGSCISACIRDRLLGIGGMNHFMLPSSDLAHDSNNNVPLISRAARYGNYAMEQLINAILSHGGQRSQLEVKVFGGGRVLKAVSDIGKQNISFIHDYLELEGLVISAEDVGDIYPRKVYYFPADGKVRVKKLHTLHNQTMAERESAYQQQIEQAPVQAEVELF